MQNFTSDISYKSNLEIDAKESTVSLDQMEIIKMPCLIPNLHKNLIQISWQVRLKQAISCCSSNPCIYFNSNKAGGWVPYPHEEVAFLGAGEFPAPLIAGQQLCMAAQM